MADVPVDERTDPRDMAHGDLVAEVDRLREIEEAARETVESLHQLSEHIEEGREVHPDVPWHLDVEVRRLRTALDADRGGQSE